MISLDRVEHARIAGAAETISGGTRRRGSAVARRHDQQPDTRLRSCRTLPGQS
jgi:hypothetical protein